MHLKCSKCFKKITVSTICYHNSDITHTSCCFICGGNGLNKDKIADKNRFDCKLCHVSLYDQNSFRFHQNEPHCLECYGKHFSKSCHSCSKCIEPNQAELEFGEASFHRECFNCINCFKKLGTLDDEKIYRDQKTGNPCCAICFNKIYRKICSKCMETIKAGQTGISYGTKAFHRECFSCFKCKTELYDKNTGKKMRFFKDKTENPICESCSENNNLNCTNCKKSINSSDKSLTYEKKFYHNECFVCSNCSTCLATNPDKTVIYKGDNNEPLCNNCYAKSKSNKCVKCSNLILPNQDETKFENKAYHKECFTCSNCNAKINESTCTKDHKNRVICQECYAKIFNKKCRKCDNFILPEQSGLRFEDKYDFHRDCFCCFKCDKKLSSRGDHVKSDNTIYFKNEHDLPICSECYEHHYCEKCHKCKGALKSNHAKITYEENPYHSQCFVCSKCSNKIIEIETVKKDENNNILCPKCSKKKEKTPPKAKAGPGKLNFGQIGAFEKKTDFDCVKCKKKIMGQKFLTHKVGEFLCKKCHQLNEASCFMCKKVFESREEFFKDESNNNYCAKCIKIYRQNNKME